MNRLILSIIVLLLAAHHLMAQDYIIDAANKGNVDFKSLQQSFIYWSKYNDLNEVKGWKWYKRWENHYMQRANPDGSLADPSIFLHEAVRITAEKDRKRGLDESNWIPAGPDYLPDSPNPYSGHGVSRINCVAFHPTDSNTMWIGASQGGVWRTTDRGNTWMPLNNGLPILRISDISVDPANTDVMYACLGDYEYIGISLKLDDRKRHTHYGLGIYKTTDGGLHWAATGLTAIQTDLDNTLFRRLIIDPNSTDTLVAGGFEGIWKSTDGGINWQNTLVDTIISDLVQDPVNPDILYAGISYIGTLDEGVAGVIKSIDFGDTWEMLNSGIPKKNEVQRVELAIAPSDPNYIYAITCDLSGGFYGLYRSTDAGDSWNQQSFGATKNIFNWSDGETSGGQGYYDLTLIVDPNDKDFIYAGGINAWGSDDGGVSWDGMSYWINYYGISIHADQHQFKYNPVSDKFYVCNDGGIMQTDTMIIGRWDSAINSEEYEWPTTWKNLSSGMQITSFYRLGLSDNNPGYIIAGAQDNGTFYYNGTQWQNILGGDGMECILDPYDPEVLWGTSQYGRMALSYEGGLYWDYNLTDYILDQGEVGEWTTPFILCNSNNSLYAGYGNLWKSTDFGYTWSKLSNFNDMPIAGFPAPASALAQCSGDCDAIYIAKRIYHVYNSLSELWRTFDGGNSWNNITNGLPDSLYFTYIAVDNNDPKIAWVTCSGFESGNKIFKTINGGDTWNNISMNLPNIPVNCVVLDEDSKKHNIYIGTDLGVYVTNDTVNNWLPFSVNLPNVIVSELEIDHASGEMYAATFGRGIWKTKIPSDPIGIREFLLYELNIELIPNPNNGAFSLSIQSGSNMVAELNIINIMGKTVYSQPLKITGGEMQKSMNIDLAAGMYFLQLTNKKSSKVLRFIKE